jgi:hypothetical protein
MSRDKVKRPVDLAIFRLAALRLIYDSGARRGGKIVWLAVPGREAEAEALLDLDRRVLKFIADRSPAMSDSADLPSRRSEQGIRPRSCRRN